METPEDGPFTLLPVISEDVVQKVLEEMDSYSRLNEAAKGEHLAGDLEALDSENSELANAIQGISRGSLEASVVSDKLTYNEWKSLEASILYGFTVTLRALNEARREQIGH